MMDNDRASTNGEQSALLREEGARFQGSGKKENLFWSAFRDLGWSDLGIASRCLRTPLGVRIRSVRRFGCTAVPPFFHEERQTAPSVRGSTMTKVIR